MFCVLAFAQGKQITGVIKDGTGEPMIGVNVLVKGTTNGTITDFDGKFAISDVKNSDVLTITYVGYVQQSIPVGNQTTFNIILKEDTETLDEVVVIGYGTVKKRDLTGSVASVSNETLTANPVSDVSQALQGKLAGVSVVSQDGRPGAEVSIRVRGGGSITQSNDPLFIVDGFPVSSISDIPADQIETIDVLKDASSTAIYGARGANGVILVTTKGAKTDKLSVTYNGYVQTKAAAKTLDPLSAQDYVKYQWAYADALERTGGAVSADGVAKYFGLGAAYGNHFVDYANVDVHDWTDDVLRNAIAHTHNLSISGGSEKTKYYFSLGYLDDQGAYICSGFKRYNLRSNITTDLRKWLQVGLNVAASHSIQNYPKQNDTAIGNIVLAARDIPSFYPVYERDMTTGEYILDENGNRVYDYGTYRKGSYNGYNFAQSMLYDKKEYKRDAASIRGYLQITPIEGLSYKMSLNIDYDSKFTHNYNNPTYGKQPLTGSVEKGNDRTTGMTYNNVINWNHTFKEDHDVRLMAGQEYYEFNTSNFSGSRTGVITDGYFEPDVASTLSSFGGNSDQYKLLSFFGSAEYSYKSKYFVSASVRTDGSSRFHPDHRWGTFWSFGGSWKISREKFLEEASNNWLSNLTLRASYGAQGNDNVGYYAYKALYSIGSSLGESTLHASRLETPELSWETNLNLNVGLDFGFWSNRLNGTIEFFQRSSKDLLFARDLVPSSGFSSIDANIGKLKNYGWEFTISGTPVMTKDWTWKLSLNATTYKNEIVELPTDVMWQSSKKWVKGGSLYDFWLYEWAGVNPENGKPQWYYTAEDGSRQVTEDYSSLTPDDKVKVGSSLPKLSGGFQSDLSWKNLSLSMLFSYAIGGKLYNNDKISMMSVKGGNGSSMSEDMLNRWTPENRYTDIPRLSYNQTSYFTSSSSRWLVNRSFLRLKTVTLSYTLPKNWIHFATLKDASIFVQGENLLTFSHQQGLDPEQPISGVVSYRYPAMKTFSFGINVTL